MCEPVQKHPSGLDPSPDTSPFAELLKAIKLEYRLYVANKLTRRRTVQRHEIRTDNI